MLAPRPELSYRYVARSCAATLVALLFTACAGRVPQSYTVGSLPSDEVAFVGPPVAAPSAAPRTILPAPPPAAPPASAAPVDTNGASSPAAPVAATFTPSDSPLLAYFDRGPHGIDPPAQIDPLFLPRSRGWTVRYRPYYGYSPYSYGGYYGARPSYYYSGYGYPGYYSSGFGVGFGLGLGWPYAFGARHYGYGGYRSYGHYYGGGGHFGGHHGGFSGHHGGHR